MKETTPASVPASFEGWLQETDKLGKVSQLHLSTVLAIFFEQQTPATSTSLILKVKGRLPLSEMVILFLVDLSEVIILFLVN